MFIFSILSCRIEIKTLLSQIWYSAQYTEFSIDTPANGYRIFLDNYVGDANEPFYSRPYDFANVRGYPFYTIGNYDYRCAATMGDGGEGDEVVENKKVTIFSS